MCGTATSTCDDKTSLGGDKKALPAIAAVASTVDGETVSPPPSNPYPSTTGFIIVFLRVRRAPPNNRSSPLITRRFSQRKYTLEHRTRFIGTDFFLRWSAQLPLFPSEISLRTRSGPSPRPRSRTTCTLILLSNYKYIYIVYHECACSCTSNVSGRCGKKNPNKRRWIVRLFGPRNTAIIIWSREKAVFVVMFYNPAVTPVRLVTRTLSRTYLAKLTRRTTPVVRVQNSAGCWILGLCRVCRAALDLHRNRTRVLITRDFQQRFSKAFVFRTKVKFDFF